MAMRTVVKDGVKWKEVLDEKGAVVRSFKADGAPKAAAPAARAEPVATLAVPGAKVPKVEPADEDGGGWIVGLALAGLLVVGVVAVAIFSKRPESPPAESDSL